MSDEDLLLGLIETIYAAPTEPEGWAPVLDELARAFDSGWAQIHVSDFWAKDVPLSDFRPLNTDSLADYVEHYMLIDPRFSGALKGDGKPLTRAELVPDDVFIRTEIYHDLLRPIQAEQNITLPLKGFQPGPNFIAILRSDRDGAFDQDDCRRLRILNGHFQQALNIQRELTTAQDAQLASAQVLDALEVGVLLLGRDGRVAHLNRAAAEIVAQNDGFAVEGHGYCSAALPGERRELAQLIGSAIMTRLGDGYHPGGAMTISRLSMKRPYAITVTPINIERMDAGRGRILAALFITDTHKQRELPVQTLSRLYGLTAAEARLAAKFVETASLKGTAASLEITEGTARQYLKRIFEKTDTKSQVALMKLLLTGPALLGKWSASLALNRAEISGGCFV